MFDVTKLPNFVPDPNSREIAASSVQIVKSPSQDFTDREVCLFLTYAPQSKVGPGIAHYAQSFVDNGIDVIMCLVVEDFETEVSVVGVNNFTSILRRKNGGYDFAFWASVLKAMPSLWNARRLYFTNDSILGPIFDMKHLLTQIRASSGDFVALTANYIDFYHAQSYFFVLQRDALKSDGVRKFWDFMPQYSTKEHVIRNCEQCQLPVYQAAGLNVDVLFPLMDIVEKLPPKAKEKFNPTHDAWETLISRGFPFLKADIIYRQGRNPKLPASISNTVRLHLRRQLEEIVGARNRTEVVKSHNHLFLVKLLIGEERFFHARAWLKRRRAMRQLF